MTPTPTTADRRSPERIRAAKTAEAEAAAKARRDRILNLGKVIRRTRGERTQAEVGERLYELTGETILQTSISRWELGMVDLSVEQIRDIEMALDVEPGAILIAAGYVTPSMTDIAPLLLSDPKVHPDLREDLSRIYTSYVEMSAKIAEATASKRPRKASR